MEHDVIVIGSGSGGMSCAAALALEGKKVLVLEQCETLGGYFGALAVDNWVWDLGCQYATASMFADGGDYRCISYLTGGALSFTPLAKAFQRLYFPGFEYTLYADREEMKAQLIRDFPHQKDQIVKYMRTLDTIARVFPKVLVPKRHSALVATLLVPFYLIRLVPYMNKYVSDELRKRFDDARLIAILSSYWSSAGLVPTQLPFLAYAVMQKLLTDGAFYPDGMARGIIASLQKTIESHHGRTEVGKRVRRILVERKRAIGVETADGTSIEAEVVVSGIGTQETIRTLIPRGQFPRRLERRINGYEQSISALILHIGFEGDLSPYVQAGQTYRVFSDTPFDLSGDPTQEGWTPANALLVFPSLCDRDYPDPNYPTATIVVLTPYRFFARYREGGGEQYERAKAKITSDLIEKVLLRCVSPGIRVQIRTTQLFTPVSLAQRTLHIDGAAYGLASTSKRLMDMHLLPRSPIRNLYFTGADVFAHGVIQTMIGGVLTASAITGQDLFRKYATRPAVLGATGT
jgi:all-trans-retinol 13,14-reductase